MIIFGTRGITYSKKKGHFNCPSCCESQAYNHKRVRSFFTLYFIPLIPLGLAGEYVECQHCRATYVQQVLENNTHEIESSSPQEIPQETTDTVEVEFHKGVRRIMIYMLLADGEIDDREIVSVKDIYLQLANTELDNETINREINEIQRGNDSAEFYAAKLGGTLNDHGKELVIKAAYLVAAADGVFQPEEKALIATLGSAMDMTKNHINGILASFDQ